jgi:hypothetical protein
MSLPKTQMEGAAMLVALLLVSSCEGAERCRDSNLCEEVCSSPSAGPGCLENCERDRKDPTCGELFTKELRCRCEVPQDDAAVAAIREQCEEELSANHKCLQATHPGLD